jgi:hypothetical protein
MMSIKQISVFLVNKPGSLKNMTSVLAANNIDMRAISLAETDEFGIARIVVDDVIRAREILEDNDFVASINSVIPVEIPDTPGGLDKILGDFAAANINIQYMYSFVLSKAEGTAGMIFRVTDTAGAEAKLAARGLKLLTWDEIKD